MPSARSHGARGLGVDIDPARIREARANARAAGVAHRVEFRRQDLFETELGEADVEDGLLANAAAPDAEVVGKAINLGTGQTISIGDLVDVVADILGRELHVQTDAQRVRPEKSEVGRLISDNTLARQATG